MSAAVVWTLITDGCVQVSVRRSQEVEDLYSLHMLQLAGASCSAFTAYGIYCHLHLQEIEVMHTIMVDECEEAETCLRKADSQIREIRHLLHLNGTALGESGIMLLSAGHGSDNESLSLVQARESHYKSPTPSSDRDYYDG